MFKKIIVIIIFFILLYNNVFAGSYWYWNNTIQPIMLFPLLCIISILLKYLIAKYYWKLSKALISSDLLIIIATYIIILACNIVIFTHDRGGENVKFILDTIPLYYFYYFTWESRLFINIITFIFVILAILIETIILFMKIRNIIWGNLLFWIAIFIINIIIEKYIATGYYTS